ncbi:hypothetical protein ABID30_002201 [Enterococcus rotai]|uniref:Uncharacterized protein n=1 Tax=Enterococcus rotai TaxID=118060 RepID=A0A0U2XEI8_9ENTE|nr:hypothetical protein [Enterococcus rotai]ALS38488.1 hypothetical protein ATZ35_15445 [Enterococcus rotai]
MEHHIQVKYYKDREKDIIEYKGVKKKNSKYLIHKIRWKEIHSDNIKMDSVAYLLHCLEHDIVKDNRIKNTDRVTVYLSLDKYYLDILNKAKQGKSAYSNLKTITNGQDRKYLIKWLKIIQKIYVKKQVSIDFKCDTGIDMNIFKLQKNYTNKYKSSYIVEQAKNTTSEEKEARREQFKVAFKQKKLNYDDLINR